MAKPVDDRYCSNCREPLPADASSCPACGVYAGDLYDERVHRAKTRFVLFGVLLLLALAAGGAAIWWSTRNALPPKPATAATAEPPPVRVVGDRPGGARRRPGAKLNEAEAILMVRRHLVVSTGVKSDCIALMGGSFRGGGYVVTAYDSCERTRLGKWRVDGKSGEVARALQ
jgi:hypothetical protein